MFAGVKRKEMQDSADINDSLLLRFLNNDLHRLEFDSSGKLAPPKKQRKRQFF